LFAGATLSPPGLAGPAWWAAVIQQMFSCGYVLGTLLGTASRAIGALLLVLPRGRYLHVMTVAVAFLAMAFIVIGIAFG